MTGASDGGAAVPLGSLASRSPITSCSSRSPSGWPYWGGDAGARLPAPGPGVGAADQVLRHAVLINFAMGVVTGAATAAVFTALYPPGHGVQRPETVADHLERRLGQPDSGGNDRGRGDLCPVGPGLPGLELLGVPAAAGQAGQPARACPRVAAAGRRPREIPAGFFLSRRGWGPCSAPIVVGPHGGHP